MSTVDISIHPLFYRPSRSPRAPLKKNPLKNRQAMLHLNPYARVQRKNSMKIELKRRKARQDAIANEDS